MGSLNRTVLRVIFVSLLSSSLIARAYDHGDDEAIFTSEDIVICYNDLNDRDCIQESIGIAGICLGDAVLLDNGTLFKAPNKSKWACNGEKCKPLNAKSILMLMAFFIKKEHYGEMTIEHFLKIMGNKSLCDG